ncbi:MAG TPA: aminoacyl-tRNA hydrolase [Vicinamibacterales bacterium]
MVGLGNPGPEYAGTRHNVGFRVIDLLAERAGVRCDRELLGALVGRTYGAVPLLLAKPLTFMNLSGRAVQALAHYHKVPLGDLLIVTDDAALPLGRLRARPGGSSGGHNGLKSVAQQLGTDAFPRLRIGIGRGDGRRDLADHVLSRFEPAEQAEVDAAIARAADAVEVFAADGIAAVMNRFNADPAKAGRKELPDTAGDSKDGQS